MKPNLLSFAASVLLLIAGAAFHAEAQKGEGSGDLAAAFPPLEQWKAAVIAGDANALNAFYSTNPAAQVEANKVEGDAGLDSNFWIGLKAQSIKISPVRVTNPRPDREHIIFNADVVSEQKNGATVTIADDQTWQKEGDQWKLLSVTRTDAPHLKQPSDMKKDIYSAGVDAHEELTEAEASAAKEHKRILLVFGANWCYDCHVLDLAFQRPDLAPILSANYQVVHVDLGPDGKKNADLVQQYAVPLNKGIPALAVAESDGKLVVSQKNGEFENARALTPDALLEFLNQWKPQSR